jgi:hypothetical protein
MATREYSRKRVAARREQTSHNHIACTQQTPACEPAVPSNTLTDALRETHHNLRLVRVTLVMAAQVLDAQNADADADIAYVLRHALGPRLDGEIEKAEAMLASHSGDGRSIAGSSGPGD